MDAFSADWVCHVSIFFSQTNLRLHAFHKYSLAAPARLGLDLLPKRLSVSACHLLCNWGFYPSEPAPHGPACPRASLRAPPPLARSTRVSATIESGRLPINPSRRTVPLPAALHVHLTPPPYDIVPICNHACCASHACATAASDSIWSLLATDASDCNLKITTTNLQNSVDVLQPLDQLNCLPDLVNLAHDTTC